MVYHTIVKHLVTQNFELVNQKNYDALLNNCTPTIRHRFGGAHSLGGERNDIDSVRLWFERLGRLLPGLTLKITDVWVKGWPWDTVVIVRWDASDVCIDGSPYRNHGVHVLKMSWGSITEIDANEDSQAVADNLGLQAKHGIEEASAPQIIS